MPLRQPPRSHPSLSRHAVRTRRSRSLVTGVTRLGHALGAWVCAEGIERPEQLDALDDAGCDEGQGFLLARPAPLPDILAAMHPGPDYPPPPEE